jgi:hypothetical protein
MVIRRTLMSHSNSRTSRDAGSGSRVIVVVIPTGGEPSPPQTNQGIDVPLCSLEGRPSAVNRQLVAHTYPLAATATGSLSGRPEDAPPQDNAHRVRGETTGEDTKRRLPRREAALDYPDTSRLVHQSCGSGARVPHTRQTWDRVIAPIDRDSRPAGAPAAPPAAAVRGKGQCVRGVAAHRRVLRDHHTNVQSIPRSRIADRAAFASVR